VVALAASVVLGGTAGKLPPPLRLPLPFLLTVTGFYFLYAVLPGVRIGPSAALRAAAAAGLLWEGAKVGLSLYASRVFSSSVVGRLYGSLSLLPVALLWIYYSWALVFLGAEAAAVLNEGSKGPWGGGKKGTSGTSGRGGAKIFSRSGA
jgi:YihY family inner membrane protein